jgi:hypothetical protein
MLNAQFIKAAGGEITDFELGLIASTPISPSNLPKTSPEAEALKKMEADPDLILMTFADGDQFKASRQTMRSSRRASTVPTVIRKIQGESSGRAI